MKGRKYWNFGCMFYRKTLYICVYVSRGLEAIKLGQHYMKVWCPGRDLGESPLCYWIPHLVPSLQTYVHILLNIMYYISKFLHFPARNKMFKGAARVHFISAGKCKKSEMLYITWLNVIGVIPFITVAKKWNVLTGSKKYCFQTDLIHLNLYFLLPGWFHMKAPQKHEFFFWIFDQKSQTFLI